VNSCNVQLLIFVLIQFVSDAMDRGTNYLWQCEEFISEVACCKAAKPQVLLKMRMQQSRRRQEVLHDKAEVILDCRKAGVRRQALMVKRQQKRPFSFMTQRRVTGKICPVGKHFVRSTDGKSKCKNKFEELEKAMDVKLLQGDYGTTDCGDANSDSFDWFVDAHLEATNEEKASTEDDKSLEIQGQESLQGDHTSQGHAAAVDQSGCNAATTDCVQVSQLSGVSVASACSGGAVPRCNEGKSCAKVDLL